MSEVLYRKYRPQTFREVLGQDVIKTLIGNAIRLGRLSHAYLFAGPRGVGKTTVARLLAKAVNCLNPREGEPDTTCENCRLIQEGRFLDLLEIDAASYTGVDNIREIIDHVKFFPSRGKYKVIIIDEVHMLSKAAFNALLKTLEEPPSHVIFVLATTEIGKVPATIISRSQRFDFRRVSQADILKLFETILPDLEIKIPLEAQSLVAQAAEGSFRDALSILDQLRSLGGKEITFDEIEMVLGVTRVEVSQKFLDLLISGEVSAATKFVKNLVFEGKDLVQFTRNFLEYLRLVLYVKMKVEKIQELGFTAEENARLLKQSESLSPSRLAELIKAILEAHRETKLSPVPELPLLTHVLAFLRELPADPPPGSDLSLGTIIDRWAEVLSRVKEYNHSLLSSLRLGKIVNLEGNELFLAFPYNFHKETIEARKNRIIVEQVLQEIFNKALKVRVYLERELEQMSKDQKDQNDASDLMTEAYRVLRKGEEK